MSVSAYFHVSWFTLCHLLTRVHSLVTFCLFFPNYFFHEWPNIINWGKQFTLSVQLICINVLPHIPTWLYKCCSFNKNSSTPKGLYKFSNIVSTQWLQIMIYLWQKVVSVLAFFFHTPERVVQYFSGLHMSMIFSVFCESFWENSGKMTSRIRH